MSEESHGSRSVVRTGSMSHLMPIPCTPVYFLSLLFEDILMIEVWHGKLFRDQFLRNCVAGHRLETTGLLDVTQDSPFTTQIGIFSNPGFSHVLYCFVVDFSQTVCQPVCPFCRNWWLLEFGSQPSHSVFCICKLNSSMNFMRIVSTVIVVKIVAAVRSHVGLETSLDMTYEEGPSAVCFCSVGSEIVNFKVKLRRIK